MRPLTWQERLPQARQNDKEIVGFFGDYRWLSNFHLAPVEFEGLTYPSSEAAYQAAKTLDLDKREDFIHMTPSQTKKAGRQIKIREDWEDVKLTVMYDILLDKFTRNQDLQDKLLETGGANLEELNWWGDKYWGTCNGEGLNHLGKTLMKVRETINSRKQEL